MKFSERMGVVSEKLIQMNSVDQNLRNRIYNFYYYVDLGAAKHILDRLGFITSKSLSREAMEVDPNRRILRKFLLECNWFTIYDIIELNLSYFNPPNQNVGIDFYERKKSELRDGLNKILEEEKSGYRIINELVVPITNEIELESIERSTHTAYPAVNIHIQKALEFYSNRNNPDYENSIKESITAVEAMCSIILGKNATLGQALKKLENTGVMIHSALQAGFEKIYGYTSDQNGIRHGGIDFTDAPAEDAKYMLVSCSAFINYLVEKYEKSL